MEVLAAALLALLPACGLLRAPQKVVKEVVPAKRSSQPDPLDLQLQLQRYADDFLTKYGQALDDYAQRVGTEPTRVEALQLKLVSSSSVVSIVSGPNPIVNLLDLVSVAVLTRMSIEEYWLRTPNGPAFQPWLEVSEGLETNAWLLAGRILTPAQIEELRQSISQWHARNPETRNSFFARPQSLAAQMTSADENKKGALSGLISLVSLDPMAGLDPAVREVTRTRLFAERALFTMQRMPFLLRWQTELLAHQLITQPELHLALTNTTRLSDSAERLSRAAESASQTAAQLPDRLSNERKEILAALDLQQGKLKELAAQVNQTLESGEKMSASLNTTITTFDALMKRFGVGESSTNAAPGTNSPPFNILDYGQVAQQIGAMSKDLNLLITSVNQSMPQVERLGQTATGDAQKLLDHGFRLALILIAVLLLGSILAGVAYRFLANKLAPPRRLPSPVNEKTSAGASASRE